MGAFLITGSLFAVTLAVSIAAILSCRNLRITIAGNWKLMLLFVMINFYLKFPFHSPFFHGREYEDCFVHQAVARQLEQLQTNEVGINPFRESIFSIGSIVSGDSSQTFYNYIGYPTTIHLLDILCGERASNGHIVSLLAACLNVTLVFLLASLLDIHPALPVIASTVYTALPLGNVFGASASADILSSFYITLVLLHIYLLAKQPGSRFEATATYIGLSSCLLFSVLIKRENVLLFAMLPCCYYFARYQSGQRRQSIMDTIKTFLLVVSPVMAFELIFLDLPSSFKEEAAASGNNMFAIRNLMVLGPAYILSFGKFQFYLVFGLTLLALPAVWFRFQVSRPIIIAVLGYTCMYSAHYRGYYYLQTYKADAWDTARYMLNLLPLVALLSSMCVVLLLFPSTTILRRRTTFALWLASFAIVALLISAHVSVPLRSELTNAEQRELIQPVLATIKTLYSMDRPDPWVFTYQPCIYQIYGPRTLNIVDLALVTRYDKDRLDAILSSGQAYACLTAWDIEPVNRTRYSEQTHWIFQRMSHVTRTIQGTTITELNAH